MCAKLLRAGELAAKKATSRSKRASSLAFELLEDRRLLALVPPGFTLTHVTSGLSQPTAMEITRTGEIWALEQTGRVKLVRGGSDHTALTLNVDSTGERGLLGVAFDPTYDGAGPNTDYLYLYYTVPRSGPTDPPNNRVSRFTVNGAGGQTPTLTNEFVLRDLPPEDEDNNPITDGDANHNGGAIHFGPDGKLYVGVGDHNYDVPAQAAHVSQVLTTPFGKILRLDPDGANPEDNPFYAGNPTDWRGSIWALGLQDPSKFAIEADTGRLFINDMGEDWQEINLVEREANYGWAGSGGPVWEGFESPPPPWSNYRDPLMAYDNDDSPPTPAGRSISGGAFYPQNSQFGSAYAGKYFFVETDGTVPFGGFIRVFDPAAPGSPAAPDTSTGFADGMANFIPVDAKVDSAGNLYFLGIGSGGIHRYSLTGGPQVIDDGGPGFSMSQGWLAGSGVGRDVDFKAALEQPGANETATWTFTVTPGQYRVSATWAENPTYWATAAPFSVLDGATTRGTALLNQRQAPNDFTYAGSPWEDIGVFDIVGTTLTVRLSSDDANGYVAADSIRIERVGPLAAGPEIRVTEGGIDIPDNTGFFDFGATELGVGIEKTFVISNVGSQSLQLGPFPTVPERFSVPGFPPLPTLGPGQSTSLVVSLFASQPGTFSGEISLATGDGDENPFNFTVTATVLPTRIVDDGGNSYTHNGLFTTDQVSLGRDGDVSYAVGGPALPSEAIWRFGSLAPGQYRIAATWFVNPTYWASNAPFTVFEGNTPLATVLINQRQPPNDFTASGSSWEYIGGVFSTTSAQINVQLSNVGADGYVIADAVRLERVGELPPPGFLPPGNSDAPGDESQAGSADPLLATAYIDEELDELAVDVAAANSQKRTSQLADDLATSSPSDRAQSQAVDEALTELPE
jgi:glucose/arabinose dehydrogenase